MSTPSPHLIKDTINSISKDLQGIAVIIAREQETETLQGASTHPENRPKRIR